jgi:type IV pilus assembly protein PilY1
MNRGTRLRSLFKPRSILAAVVASLAIGGAGAEDIDIFSANTTNAHAPNVLIIIDNSSNWSASLTASQACTDLGYPGTKFGAEMCALDNVIRGLPANFRVGLMMFAESGNNGAYVRFGIRDMTDRNKTALRTMLQNFVSSGAGTDNSGSNQPYAKTMFEAFKYFGGYTDQDNATRDVAGSPISNVAFGNATFAGGNDNDSGTFRRDYPTNNGANNRAAARYNASSGDDNRDYAYPSNTSNSYNSPIRDNCADNFIIFISNGNPGTGGDSSINPARDTQILSNLHVKQTCIPNCTSELHASKMDEMAKFLYETDVSPRPGQQKVQTYTVAVYAPQNNGSISNTDQAMISLMQSTATNGGGRFCAATSAAEVAKCIQDTMNELQAVNSVFVSSSLPVSVNAQGTFLNQVYMGMFRPDQESSPRWVGNLKEYKVLKDVNGGLFLADSVDAPAVSNSTGFITPAAKSFWTSSSTFWANNLMGTPPSSSDFPDGEVVEKGGAAQRVRTVYATDQAARKVFTCPATGCVAGVLDHEFAANNAALTARTTEFGAATSADVQTIVNWTRGQDNALAAPCAVGTSTCPAWQSAERGPGWPTTVRPGVHGDVLHARPVVLNYRTQGVYIFYGANDGMLRAVKGGRTGTDDGKEAWSFVAPEFFGKLKRLRTESPTLILPTVPGLNKKDYFFDGPISAFQDDTRAWIFVTARRGGRFIYAFDVTDPTQPRFMWKVSNTDAGFSELGQTWSEPTAVKVKASTDPVLIVGGGYDPNEDSSPAGTTTMGRAIFVLNARTGALLKTFTTAANGGGITKSVPSDLILLDRDADTFADRAYVGDTGGNVWRLDIDDANVNNWKLSKLATLGGSFKFFFRPDVITTRFYDAVLIGSGDREKPLVQDSTDYFFMLKDTVTGNDGSGIVPLGFGDLVLNGTVSDPVKGWYVQMRPGEKVVNAPLTISGITFFATNRPTPPDPDSNSCAVNLGEARGYAMDFLTGGAGVDRNGDGTKNTSEISVVLKGGGLPPSPVGGVLQLDDGSTVPFCIGCNLSGKPPEADLPPGNIPKVRKKLYWNTSTDK